MNNKLCFLILCALGIFSACETTTEQPLNKVSSIEKTPIKALPTEKLPIKELPACYEDICIGDDIKKSNIIFIKPEEYMYANIKRRFPNKSDSEIKYELEKAIYPNNVEKEDNITYLKKLYPATANSDLQILSKYSHRFIGGYIDTEIYKVLKNINIICRYANFFGDYKSKSGRDVRIHYSTVFQENKGAQIQVSSIIVNYNDGDMSIGAVESEKILAALKNKYGNVAEIMDDNSRFVFVRGLFSIGEAEDRIRREASRLILPNAPSNIVDLQLGNTDVCKKYLEVKL